MAGVGAQGLRIGMTYDTSGSEEDIMDNRIGLVMGLGLTLCAGAASAAGYYNLDQGIESLDRRFDGCASG